MAINEIELLKQQKKEIEDNIVAVNSGVKVGNPMELLDELNAVSNKISDLEYQAKLHEDIQSSVTTEVAKFMDTLDFEGAEPKELFLNYSAEGAESSYNYVNAVIQNAVAKMKQAEISNTKTFEATISMLQEKSDKLQREKEELSHDLSVQNLEISDLNARLANATRLLDEEKAEVERLSSQVDDLRKEIAIGAAAATKVEEVDVRSEREKWLEQRQREEDAKPVIYNIRWKDDARRDTYLAELAKTDETIEIPYYAMTGDMSNGGTTMKGKYRVVTSEAAPSFRDVTMEPQETETQYSVPDSTQPMVVEEQPVTVPAFQSEDSTAGGLDQSDAGSEMAGKTVEERLQALELAVFGKAEVEAA